MNIQLISEILIREDTIDLHKTILRSVDSQGLSSEEARFILSRATSGSTSHQLLLAFAHWYLGEYDRAIHSLDSLLTANQVTAMVCRARMYRAGQGTPDGRPDYPAATALLDKAIEQGNTQAMVYRAVMYHAGQGTPDGRPDYPAAIALLDKAIERGDTQAMVSRVDMYRAGMGTPDGRPDYPAAIALLDKAIEQGDAQAMVSRAVMYRDGQGTPDGRPDYPAAIALLDKAIERGDAQAMACRAAMYRAGKGTPDGRPDYPAAIALFDKAIEQGDTQAMVSRAAMYRAGKGTPDGRPDYPAAIALLDKAIERGDAQAMVSRAVMYRDGKGTPDGRPDYPAAIALLDKAIERGDTQAMVSRAAMYHDGKGTPDGRPDYPAAIALFDKAIEQGDTQAMVSRAVMYRDGQGTPDGRPDYPAAIALLDKAIERGDAQAMVSRADIHINNAMTQNREAAYSDAINLIIGATQLKYPYHNHIKQLLTRLIQKEYLAAEYFLFTQLYAADGYFPQNKIDAIDLFKKHPVEHFVSYCHARIAAVKQDDMVEAKYEAYVVCLNELLDNIPPQQHTPIVQATIHRFQAYAEFFIAHDISKAYKTFRLIPKEYLSAEDLYELSHIVWLNPEYSNHRDTALSLAIELAEYAKDRAPEDAAILKHQDMLNKLFLKRNMLTSEARQSLSPKEMLQINARNRTLNRASQQISELKRYHAYLQEKDRFEPNKANSNRYDSLSIWKTTSINTPEHLQAVVSTLIQKLDIGNTLEQLLEQEEIKKACALDNNFSALLARLKELPFLPALTRDTMTDLSESSMSLSPR